MKCTPNWRDNTYDDNGDVNRTVYISDDGTVTVTDRYGNVILEGSAPDDYDYISLSAMNGGINITISWDNFGNRYQSVGAGLGGGVSLYFGKLYDNYVTEDETKNFLTGFSAGYSNGFTFGVGVNKSLSNSMFAVEHGYSMRWSFSVNFGW